MNVIEIGQQLVKHCNAQREDLVRAELYANSIVSIEPFAEGEGDTPGVMSGIEAIAGKHAWWEANHEVHAAVAEGPYVGQRENEFVVKFSIDFTPRDAQRMHIEELGIYTVQNGKIIREEFLHQPQA